VTRARTAAGKAKENAKRPLDPSPTRDRHREVEFVELDALFPVAPGAGIGTEGFVKGLVAGRNLTDRSSPVFNTEQGSGPEGDRLGSPLAPPFEGLFPAFLPNLCGVARFVLPGTLHGTQGGEAPFGLGHKLPFGIDLKVPAKATGGGFARFEETRLEACSVGTDFLCPLPRGVPGEVVPLREQTFLFGLGTHDAAVVAVVGFARKGCAAGQASGEGEQRESLVQGHRLHSGMSLRAMFTLSARLSSSMHAWDSAWVGAGKQAPGQVAPLQAMASTQA